LEGQDLILLSGGGREIDDYGVWLGVDSAMVEELWVSTQACSGLRQLWHGTTLHDGACFDRFLLAPFLGCNSRSKEACLLCLYC